VVLGNGQLVLTPGRHELALSADGYRPLTRQLDVVARDRAPLELTLAPESGTPSAPPPAAAPTPQQTGAPPASAAASHPSGPAPSDSSTPADSSRTTWGIVALSVGGAGLIASGVTAAIALGKKSDLDKACMERRCPPEQHDQVDSYDRLRIASTATLIVGALGTAVGAYLLLLGGDPEQPQSASVRAAVGPGFIAVHGSL
jgi:hypothetical protein